MLEQLNDDDAWQRSELALNQRTIRVYQLAPQIVRIDTTTASSYGTVSADGLLQFGYSKDHRPDLGQVKIASATLDPLGMLGSLRRLCGYGVSEKVLSQKRARLYETLTLHDFMRLDTCASRLSPREHSRAFHPFPIYNCSDQVGRNRQESHNWENPAGQII